MNKTSIGIDAGKHTVKCVYSSQGGNTKEISFPARYEEYNSIMANRNIDYVEVDGEKYFVGNENLSEGTEDDNSKDDFVHKICIYTAIAKCANIGDALNVAIGCPIEIFKDDNASQMYLKNMFPSKELKFKFNGRDVHYTINCRVVLSETLGVLESVPEYKNGIIAVADLGGLNSQFCVFKNGMPISKTAKSQKFGSNILVKAVLDELRAAQLSVSYDEGIDYIRYGYVEGKESISKPIIEKAIKNNLKKIKESINNGAWVDYQNVKLIFSGGTSCLLRDRILEIFPNAVILDDKDAVFANARAFHAVFANNKK